MPSRSPLPIDNRALVSGLVAERRLLAAVDPSTLPPPDPVNVPPERVAGMLLGLAVGDSLGNTSEARSPARRRAAHGDIRDYLANRHAAGRRVGLPSDDTQLAFWTLEQLLEDGGLVPERLANRFASSGPIFGIGSTIKSFLRELSTGTSWLDASQASAGNGALMRIAPVLLPHLGAPSSALWSDALLAGAITHNDYASNACCVAFTNILWAALSATPPVPPGFWLSAFETAASALEGEERRYAPRFPGQDPSKVALWRFASSRVREASAAHRAALDACESWYSGAYLLETMPSVLFILERHGNEPEEAIVRAVNDTWDNDTVAAIVGAAVGALHGVSALPRRWRDGLLGRTGAEDDGCVQKLVETASARWCVRAASDTHLSLKTALLEATKNRRVCPLPDPWKVLFEMLPERRPHSPALPLILAAWHDSPALAKMLRLREHLEWADDHGCLEEAYAFLRSLPEDAWLHLE